MRTLTIWKEKKIIKKRKETWKQKGNNTRKNKERVMKMIYKKWKSKMKDNKYQIKQEVTVERMITL